MKSYKPREMEYLPLEKEETEWQDIVLYSVLGFLVLLALTIMQFYPFYVPKVHAEAIMTKQGACELVAEGVPVQGATPEQVANYCKTI